MLTVKKIFGPTLQGEGTDAGSPSIFIRFAGCNMWDGNPETRSKSQCPYCDTDFWRGERTNVLNVFATILKMSQGRKYLIVFSGGEPLLQDENDIITLIELLRDSGFRTQLETNGTVMSKSIYMFDSVCCSPKVPLDKCKIIWRLVTTLKLLYPHPNPAITPESFNSVFVADKYLQPIDEIEDNNPLGMTSSNVGKTITKLLRLGAPWKLSLQTHKILGLP